MTEASLFPTQISSCRSASASSCSKPRRLKPRPHGSRIQNASLKDLHVLAKHSGRYQLSARPLRSGGMLPSRLHTWPCQRVTSIQPVAPSSKALRISRCANSGALACGRCGCQFFAQSVLLSMSILSAQNTKKSYHIVCNVYYIIYNTI